MKGIPPQRREKKGKGPEKSPVSGFLCLYLFQLSERTPAYV